MDFDKLNTFYHVANLKSITGAADILKIDKSSVSRHIVLLEEQVGRTLFERVGRKMVLTHDGEFLFSKARNILLEIEATKSYLRADGNEVSGLLRVSTTHALASSWLSRILHLFVEKYPQIRLEILATTENLDLSLRETDIAIRPIFKAADHLVQNPLIKFRIRLYAHKNYLKKFGIPKNREALDHHRLITLGEPSHLYPKNHTDWPLVMGAKPGSPRKPFLVINSLEGMLNLVKAGVGIGSFADGLPLLEGSMLVPILHDEMHHDVEAHYIYPTQYQGVKKIIVFEEFLREYINNIGIVYDY